VLVVRWKALRGAAVRLYGVSAALETLAAIVVLTLILPDYTTTVSGPFYSPGQLGFVAIVSLVLYGMFVFVQHDRVSLAE
jgi:Ca2+:H+ antiporter